QNSARSVVGALIQSTFAGVGSLLAVLHIETILWTRVAFFNLSQDLPHSLRECKGHRLCTGKISRIPVHLRKRKHLPEDYIPGAVPVMLEDLNRLRRGGSRVGPEERNIPHGIEKEVAVVELHVHTPERRVQPRPVKLYPAPAESNEVSARH